VWNSVPGESQQFLIARIRAIDIILVGPEREFCEQNRDVEDNPRRRRSLLEVDLSVPGEVVAERPYTSGDEEPDQPYRLGGEQRKERRAVKKQEADEMPHQVGGLLVADDEEIPGFECWISVSVTRKRGHGSATRMEALDGCAWR